TIMGIGARVAGADSPHYGPRATICDMGQLLLLTIGALVVGAIGFGIAVLISGSDPGLQPVEPEGRAVALPVDRPLVESDLGTARFDTALRGYRMAQVDIALRRTAYDIGYKQELIGVLEAEVDALREGRLDQADKLRSARQAALSAITGGPHPTGSETEPGAGPGAEPETEPDEKKTEETRMGDGTEDSGETGSAAGDRANGAQREGAGSSEWVSKASQPADRSQRMRLP